MTTHFNKQHSTDYEHFSIDYHQQNYPNQKAYHWKYIGEDILYNCGYIQSYQQLRLKRKEQYENDGTYYNLKQEYGLDGISVEYNEEDNTNMYHGIQCKLYKRNITANDLGTFKEQMEFIRDKYDGSIGYLYYSSGLEKTMKYYNDNRRKKLYEYTKLNFNKEILDEFNQRRNTNQHSTFY